MPRGICFAYMALGIPARQDDEGICVVVDVPTRHSSLYGEAKAFLGAVLPALAIVLMLRMTVVSLYRVPSESMMPTIRVGDCLLGDKLGCRLGVPEVGDVITFESPEKAGVTLVKRVVATEGQTVDLRDGLVYVDGVALDEQYDGSAMTGQPAIDADRTVTYPHVVAEGCVWVMGDNRVNSRDSRWFGDVSVSSVSSRVVAIVWPLGRACWMP